jgi:hypothetical protein
MPPHLHVTCAMQAQTHVSPNNPNELMDETTTITPPMSHSQTTLTHNPKQ